MVQSYRKLKRENFSGLNSISCTQTNLYHMTVAERLILYDNNVYVIFYKLYVQKNIHLIRLVVCLNKYCNICIFFYFGIPDESIIRYDLTTLSLRSLIMFMDNVGNARKDVGIIFVPLPFLSSFSKFVLQGQIIGIHVSLSSTMHLSF